MICICSIIMSGTCTDWQRGVDPSADPALRGKKTHSPRTVESISIFSLESDFKKVSQGCLYRHFGLDNDRGGFRIKSVGMGGVITRGGVLGV